MLERLVNYWPIDNHVNDTINGANMYNGYNVEFVKDRFGKANSAVRFTDGYYQVPPGIYFKGDFTISVWLKLNVYVANSRVLDFGNGPYFDNVLLTTINDNTLSYLYTSFSYVSGSFLYSSLPLIKGQWLHLAATLRGTTGSVYINGVLVAQSNSMFTPKSINRTSNYVGKNNWDGYGNLWGDLDDLRIYDKALSQSEVYDLLYCSSDLNAFNATSNSTNSISTSTNKPSITNETTSFKY